MESYQPKSWTTKQLKSGKFSVVENKKNIMVTNCYGRSEDRKRAMLASAAPDLLEALKKSTDILSEIKSFKFPEDLINDIKNMIKRNITAIAKAKGLSS